jgi:hypothetical protein
VVAPAGWSAWMHGIILVPALLKGPVPPALIENLGNLRFDKIAFARLAREAITCDARRRLATINA